MSSNSLDNLAKTNQLKIESFDQNEFEGLIKSAKTSLKDASHTSLELESRFHLAYHAAHSFALAALRWHGYRSTTRYIVFQVLPLTLGIDNTTWRFLAKCHDQRNIAEYEGFLEVSEQMLADLLLAAKELQNKVQNLN